jgi:hypothetical protein
MTQNANQAEPNQQPAEARHQAWCPRPKLPPGAYRCPRCNVWQPANTAALTHGAYRSLDRPEALAAKLQKRTELIEHFSGEVSVIKADLLEDYACLDVLISTVVGNIEVGGILTPKGHTRAAVTLLMSLMDRRLRLAMTLGLERASKTLTPSEYWQQKQLARKVLK